MAITGRAVTSYWLVVCATSVLSMVAIVILTPVVPILMLVLGKSRSAPKADGYYSHNNVFFHIFLFHQIVAAAVLMQEEKQFRL
jgi:hypothetical protein